MVNGATGTTWEEQTLAMLKQAKVERKRAEEEVVFLVNLTDTLEEVLELSRRRSAINVDNHTIDPESLRKKSVRDALIEIAKSNNGLLVVHSAIEILIQTGVYKEREQARGTVYSIVSRDGRRRGEHFVKERPGIYRLITATTPSVQFGMSS